MNRVDETIVTILFYFNSYCPILNEFEEIKLKMKMRHSMTLNLDSNKFVSYFLSQDSQF